MHDELLDALDEEQRTLASMVAPLDAESLLKPSRCDGWSIADVLVHLAQTNELAAASTRGLFGEAVQSAPQVGEAADVDQWAAAAVHAESDTSPETARTRWLASASAQVDAFRGIDSSARVQWVSGELAARSLATTRLAETWIHSADIAWGLGLDLEPSRRLWHIARLAHRTLPYAFARAGEEPTGEVAFVLDAPDGTEWAFGDPAAPTVLRGPALELCQVAGQRVRAGDTSLRGVGPDAIAALAVVRTFA